VRSAGAPLHHCREARESASLKNAVLARRAAVLTTIEYLLVTSENVKSIHRCKHSQERLSKLTFVHITVKFHFR
jgi:hypothetical protein